MNKLLKASNLPWAILGAGVLGALLRALLYATGVDDRGLLISGHAANVMLWLVNICVAAMLGLGIWNLKQAPKYKFNFPASGTGAVGTAMAGVGILVTSSMELASAGDSVAVFGGILGLFSACALCFLGYCRWKGLHPTVLMNGLVCVYLMIHLVGQYRLWSSSPQIQNYGYSLLATVSVMLACYHSAAFADNAGNRRMHTLFHLAAVYFCLVSLPHCENPLFYLTMAAWMFTDRCNLTPFPRAARGAR